jgi:hypothetical protein
LTIGNDQSANAIAGALENAVAQHLCGEFLRVLKKANVAALQDLIDGIVKNSSKEFEAYEPRRAGILFWKDFLSGTPNRLTAEQLAYSLGYKGIDFSEIRRLAKKYGLPLKRSSNRGGRGKTQKIFNGKNGS